MSLISAWRESRPYCCDYVLAAGKLPRTAHYTEWTIGTVPLCYPLGQILLAGHYRAGLRHIVDVAFLGVDLHIEAEFGWLESLIS